MALHYLGAQRYGIWLTISSLATLAAVLDFGLGNGLVNSISSQSRDSIAGRAAVSSVMVILFAVAVFAALALLGLSKLLPWGLLYNISAPKLVAEATNASVVLIGFVITNLLFSVAEKVQFGLQRGYVNNLWQVLGNSVSLALVVSSIKAGASLPILTLSMVAPPFAATAANTFFLFFISRPDLRPRLYCANFSIGVRLIGMGLPFFFLAVANIAGTSIDKFLINKFLGAEAVVEYAIVERLYVVTFITQLAISPLWPAYSQAFAEKDFQWTRVCFSRILALAAILSIFFFLSISFGGQQIVRFWIGPEAVVSMSLLLAYGLFRLVSGVAEAAMPILHTKQLLRFLLIITVAAGSCSLLLKLILMKIFPGSSSVAWAAAITYGCIFSIPALVVSRRAALGLIK